MEHHKTSLWDAHKAKVSSSICETYVDVASGSTMHRNHFAGLSVLYTFVHVVCHPLENIYTRWRLLPSPFILSYIYVYLCFLAITVMPCAKYKKLCSVQWEEALLCTYTIQFFMGVFCAFPPYRTSVCNFNWIFVILQRATHTHTTCVCVCVCVEWNRTVCYGMLQLELHKR